MDPNDEKVKQEFKAYEKRLLKRRIQSYELHDAWKLYRKYFDQKGFASNQIDSYNWFYDTVKSIPDQKIIVFGDTIIENEMEVDRQVHQITIENFAFSLPAHFFPHMHLSVLKWFYFYQL